MCGICGEVSFAAPPDAEGVRRAARALAHRGPDGEGFFVEGPAALGHRRLSILDLERSSQPMIRDGVAIAFNGEAYDFQSLRNVLRGLGHSFTTAGDTEVVLRAYLQWGEDFARHVQGMFAVALWDGRAQKLVLARDRLGKKPLYYAQQGERLVFGSELKALFAHGAIARDLDPTALVQYLAAECVPGDTAIVRGVRKLPPAHVAVFDRHGLRLSRYWELPAPAETHAFSLPTGDAALPSGPVHEAAGELLRLLDRAVHKRLVADVPVGVFLSGGIDSTSIAALAARHKSPLRTFSIGFTEESFDESPWAELAATRLGTDHLLEKFSADACAALLPEAAAQLDEPFADPSYLPTLLLSRFTRQHVTVALSGDGGDELFAGYDPFLAHRPAQLVARVPRPLRQLAQALVHRLPSSPKNMSLDFRLKQFLRGIDAGPSLRHQAWIGSFLPDELAGLLAPELRPYARPEVVFAPVLAEAERSQRAGVAAGSVDEALRFYLTRYLVDDILVKADRASMAASLELRAPYLDTQVVEFAARLPWRMKLSLTRTKAILKRALAGVVPDEILARPKKGFGIPVAAWLRGPLRPVVEDALSERALRESGLFEPRAVRALVDRHLSGAADLRKPLWTLLCLQLWRRNFGAQSLAVGKAA